MRPERCAVCSGIRNLDRHHMHARGMGGSKDPAVNADDNLITLCRSCHRNIHEGGWELQRSAAVFRVVDRQTGQEVMRRMRSPTFNPSSFLQLLNDIDQSLGEAPKLVAYLDDDQLVEAFRASRSLGRRSWMLQAAILHEAQRRSVYKDHLLEGIARTFEISLNLAEKYTRVWREFFDVGTNQEIFNVEDMFLEEPSWYIVAATESPDPQRWLAYAQDKKAEDPRYSISAFRSEIQQATGAAATVIESEPTNPTAFAERTVWGCPWVKPYCQRSGRPVAADECPCERNGYVSAAASD